MFESVDGTGSQRNFQLLGGGQFISNIGGQLATIALPEAVIVLLGATPLQVGALQAECGIVPLRAMVAGVCVDRFPRRLMMIGASRTRCGSRFAAVRVCAASSGPGAILYRELHRRARLGRVRLRLRALLGRMNATSRTLVWGMLPIGALVGGSLGTALGIAPPIVGGSIALGVAIWMLGCPDVVLDSSGTRAVEVLGAAQRE
jgi:hypothetical protein